MLDVGNFFSEFSGTDGTCKQEIMVSSSSSSAVQPWVGFGLLLRFRNNFFYGVRFTLTPNPQHGGPGYSFLSGSSPLTCLAWEALPVAYATNNIALGII
jgi:hypothetical protein